MNQNRQDNKQQPGANQKSTITNPLNNNQINSAMSQEQISQNTQPVQQTNHVSNVSQPSELTFAESLAKNNVFLKIFQKSKMFFTNHKKPTLVVLSGLSLMLIGLILFNTFYDFTKIKWDDQYLGQKHFAVNSSLKLKAHAYDRSGKELKNLKFETTKGKIVVKNNIVDWQLPNEIGKYEIKAISPSGKTIVRQISTVKTPESQPLILKDDKNKIDQKADQDDDGMNHEEEKTKGTNPFLIDTDYDGIPDGEEKNYKTNPLKNDSDGDGLSDGAEIAAGFDPNKSDSKGDGLKDGDRKYTQNVTSQDQSVDLIIEGKGDIHNSSIEIIDNQVLASQPGFLPNFYEFSTTGKMNKAQVKIKYSREEINQKGFSEDNLSLYYFDTNQNTFEKINSLIDKNAQTISAELKRLSLYAIGDTKIAQIENKNNILFVIDESGSMYTQKQLAKRGVKVKATHVGNDENFLRIEKSKQLIDNMKGSDNYATMVFADGTRLEQDFTNDKKLIKEKLDSIKKVDNYFASSVFVRGTNISKALTNSLEVFSPKQNSNNKIIFLTDGESTSGHLRLEKERILATAKDKKVQICFVALGENPETKELEDIGSATGCQLSFANNVDFLDGVYRELSSKINFNVTSEPIKLEDEEITSKRIKIVDNGFQMGKDNFSFSNFRSNRSLGGHCYGMAAFASLYYQNKLPKKLLPIEVDVSGVADTEMSSNGYDLRWGYFSNQNTLYNYNFQTKALKTYLESVTQPPVDYRNVINDGVWMINKKYHDLFDTIGIDFKVAGVKPGMPDNAESFRYTNLNLDKKEFTDNVKDEEKQLFEAIWRFFVTQTAGLKELEVIWKNSSLVIESMIDKMKNKEAPVLAISHSTGGRHAVNPIGYYKILNKNEFLLEIYDNNYPSKSQYIKVKKRKVLRSSPDKTKGFYYKDYYDFEYQNDILTDFYLSDVKVQ